MREWYNGSIVAFQAIDPGSTPGSRSFFLQNYYSNCCTCAGKAIAHYTLGSVET